jgi:hypothetical protein
MMAVALDQFSVTFQLVSILSLNGLHPVQVEQYTCCFFSEHKKARLIDPTLQYMTVLQLVTWMADLYYANYVCLILM